LQEYIWYKDSKEVTEGKPGGWEEGKKTQKRWMDVDVST
jgi:hypothetical protein